MKKISIYIVIGCFVISCGTKKKAIDNDPKKVPQTEKQEKKSSEKSTVAVPTVNKINSTEAYITTFAPVAVEEMKVYGIPASITIAQGILESGSGRGRLAVEANNHFGIKCHDWKGKRIYHDDDATQECFRKYNDASESFRDHSEFLTLRKRYATLFKLDEDDYKSWAKGLKKAGYATDRKYPQKLINLIERYELYKYDDLVLKTKKKTSRNKKKTNTRHIVQKGETLYSISKKYSISIEKLKLLNALQDNIIHVGEVLKVK